MEKILTNPGINTDSITKLRNKSQRRNSRPAKVQCMSNLVVEINKKRYQVENITDYNFEIESVVPLETDKNHDGQFIDGQKILFDVKFRARKISDNRFQCRFSDLSLEKRQSLSRHLSRIRNPDAQGDSLNQMSYDQIASGFTTQPMTDASVESTAESSTENAGARKSTRMLAVFVLLAAIIGIFLLVSLFVQTKNQIKINNAALVGNYLPIQSSAEGLITGIAFRDGETVKAGDVLFKVQNKEAEMEVAFAQAEIEQADAQVTALEQLIFDYHVKLELVAENIAQRILMAKADLRMAQLESQSQNTVTISKRKLLDQGLISPLEYERSQSDLEILLAEVQAKRAQLGILEVDYKAATEKGILSMGDILEDQLGQLKSELTLSKANKNRARANLKAISQNLIEIQAPTDGRIYAVYRKKGEFVKQAEPILSISQNDHYWASGSVDSEEAHRILPGQEVQVKISSMDLAVTGEVAAVGHRAVYTQGGWSQDFRSAGLSVPIKVWLPSLPADVPSGLRMKMVVKLGFKWPWEGAEDSLLSAHADEIDDPDLDSIRIINAASKSSLDSRPSKQPLTSFSADQSWDTKLASTLSTKLQGVSGTRVYQQRPGVVNIRITNEDGFRSGGHILAHADRTTVSAIGIVLREHKDVFINIIGHTDNVTPSATDQYPTNQALSLARAKSAEKVLNLDVGLPKYRLSATGNSDLSPIASNVTVAGRQQNRRIEFELTRRFERVN